MVKRQNGWSFTTQLLWAAVFVLAVTFAAPLAFADTYTLIMSPTSCGDNKAPCDSYTFTTTVATTAQANVFNVTFDVKDTGKIVNNQLVYDNSVFTNFGLTLFTGSASTSSLIETPPLPSGDTAMLVDNNKTNNGNNMCGSQNALTGSVCLEFTSGTGIPMIGPNAEQSFSFQVEIGGTAPYILNSWHIMASASPAVYNSKTQTYSAGNGNVYALTNNGSPTFIPAPPPPPPQTPEPASIALFGGGLLALAGLIRRKK